MRVKPSIQMKGVLWYYLAVYWQDWTQDLVSVWRHSASCYSTPTALCQGNQDQLEHSVGHWLGILGHWELGVLF